jgi:hypothetical protein
MGLLGEVGHPLYSYRGETQNQTILVFLRKSEGRVGFEV